MKMLQPVAPPNYAKFAFFTMIFFGFVAETHIAYGRNTVIIIGKAKGCLGLKAEDFQTITAHSVFQTSNLTSSTTPGRKRVGIRALLANVRLQKKEMDKMGLRLEKNLCQISLLCTQRPGMR